MPYMDIENLYDKNNRLESRARLVVFKDGKPRLSVALTPEQILGLIEGLSDSYNRLTNFIETGELPEGAKNAEADDRLP